MIAGSVLGDFLFMELRDSLSEFQLPARLGTKAELTKLGHSKLLRNMKHS